jgi:hypothetical protein
MGQQRFWPWALTGSAAATVAAFSVQSHMSTNEGNYLRWLVLVSLKWLDAWLPSVNLSRQESNHA